MRNAIKIIRRLAMPFRRAARRPNAGQALVELALALPLFVLLIVGAAELGRIEYIKSEVVNAARAGVAYGAQNPTTAADLIGMETAAKNDASYISEVLNVTAANYCACSNALTTQISCTTTPASCTTSPLHSISFVQVNTTATVSTLFHYPWLPASFVLGGQAIMTVEQQ